MSISTLAIDTQKAKNGLSETERVVQEYEEAVPDNIFNAFFAPRISTSKEVVGSERIIQEYFRMFINGFFRPEMSIWKLPGGSIPKRMTPGAIGYDVFARAIVHVEEKDVLGFRRTLWDLNHPDTADPSIRANLQKVPKKGGGMKWVYMLRPGERTVIGVGFATAMLCPKFFWVTPRSGSSTKYGITLSNAPGTVDPDYRGEACAAMRHQGKEDYPIEKDTRVCQCLFQWAILPHFNVVKNHSDLPKSFRSTDGLGATGQHGESDLEKRKSQL